MKSTRILLLLALLMIVTLAACSHDEPATAESRLTPIVARVAEAESVSQRKNIDAYGTVQPARQAFVSSRIMGPIVSITTSPGDMVRKGQTLAEIQPETSQGQVAQAAGALAQAAAGAALAERNLRRYEALFAEKAASQVELDMARMQHEQARGAVDQASGAVKAAQAVAGDAAVTAPFAARVVEKLVEVGDMAAPGRPLIRLESMEGSQLWITVRESDISHIEAGQTMAVTLDSRPDLGVLAGTVAEIMPSADRATHTFTVKIDLGDIAVASGIFGRASFAGDANTRILIPASAVHARGGLELVIVQAGDATARTRAVTTGATTEDGQVEILSGIKAGESVVIDAAAPVADGTPIEVRS